MPRIGSRHKTIQERIYLACPDCGAEQWVYAYEDDDWTDIFWDCEGIDNDGESSCGESFCIADWVEDTEIRPITYTCKKQRSLLTSEETLYNLLSQ